MGYKWTRDRSYKVRSVFIHQMLCELFCGWAKPIMLQRCYQNNCIRIDTWFVHAFMHICAGSSIDRYMELSLSTELFSYHLISTDTSSQGKLGTGLLESYPVVYPYHIIPITLTSLSSIVSWNRMIINTNLFADASNWIFYLAYLCEAINSCGRCVFACFPRGFRKGYRFYYTDTLFALVKPIHKTPLPMITLTISVKLLEGR